MTLIEAAIRYHYTPDQTEYFSIRSRFLCHAVDRAYYHSRFFTEAELKKAVKDITMVIREEYTLTKYFVRMGFLTTKEADTDHKLVADLKKKFWIKMFDLPEDIFDD